MNKFLFISAFFLSAAVSIHAGFSLQVEDYFEKCNAIAPTKTLPLTTEEYERSYSNLEKEIKIGEELSYGTDDAVVFNIHTFCKNACTWKFLTTTLYA